MKIIIPVPTRKIEIKEVVNTGETEHYKTTIIKLKKKEKVRFCGNLGCLQGG